MLLFQLDTKQVEKNEQMLKEAFKSLSNLAKTNPEDFKSIVEVVKSLSNLAKTNPEAFKSMVKDTVEDIKNKIKREDAKNQVDKVKPQNTDFWQDTLQKKK